MSEDTKLGDRFEFLKALAKGLNLNIDVARKQLFDEVALESQFDNIDERKSVAKAEADSVADVAIERGKSLKENKPKAITEAEAKKKRNVFLSGK